jgi:Protein of unknown function (DUF3616)
MFSDRKADVWYIVVLVAAWFLTGTTLLHGGMAAAEGNKPWKVEGKLIGKPRGLDVLDSKKANDVSGIACATTSGFLRICLLTDDETQGAQIVILRKDQLIAGDFIRLIHHTYDGELIELDAEGVGYADGYFYIIGSHGRARHEKDDIKKEAKNEAKAEASRHVFRVRLDLDSVNDNGRFSGAPEIKPSTELPRFIRDEPKLASTFDVPLDDNGLTIEGVAVRDGWLYAGMRGPVLDNGDAVILSVPLGVLFEGQQGEQQTHFLNLGRDTLKNTRGVRDLVAFKNGFFVLAGPVSDPPNDEVEDSDYAVFWWDGKATPKKLADIKDYGKKVKPEGLVPLDQRGNRLDVLLFFDGPDEGEPRPVEIDQP